MYLSGLARSKWIFESRSGAKIPYSEEEAAKLEEMWLAMIEENGPDV